MRRVAHPRGGLSCVLAYNSADSESSEPVLQHAMYYRLYHRSWFAGRKTYPRHYARHVSLRVTPAGLRDRDCRSTTEGCFPAIQRSLSRPGNLSRSHLSQARQRVSRGVVRGCGKQRAAAGTHGPPGGTPYMCRCARQRLVVGGYPICVTGGLLEPHQHPIGITLQLRRLAA